MRFTFPNPERLPWLLFGVSCALLAWGVMSDSTELLTIGSLGVALTLLAFGLAPRLLGPPAEDGSESCDHDGRDEQPEVSSRD